MGYRGEDVSRTPADWGHQAPRQSSPGTGQGNAGSWVDGAQGYGNDDYDNYASDGTGYGDQRGDGYGGYPQQGQGQYSQPDAYGSQAPYGEPSGYDRPAGYTQPTDHGYQQSAGPDAGYGVGQGPQSQYGQQEHFRQPEPGYDVPGGGQGYQAPNDGYGQPNGYPARHGGSGGYPALPEGSDGYQGRDAGNDWYGGQPAAASGAGFADTGTFAMNGRITDEYGTGPSETQRNSARGYPPAPGQPAISGPQAVPRTGAQEQYNEYDSYPDYGREQYQDGSGRNPTGGYPTTTGNPTGGYPAAGRNATGDYPTAVRNPSGSYPAAGRNATGEYPMAVRNPSGSYPAAGRNPTGDYPTAVRNPSGSYPAAGRNPTGDYPTTVGGQTGGHPAAVRDYDAYDYDNPAVGYDDYATDDPYQDRYGEGEGDGGRGAGTSGRAKTRKGAPKRGGAKPARQAPPGGRRPRTLALAMGTVFVVAVACAAAYFLVLKPHSSTPNPDAGGRLPTAGASPSDQACVQQYGTYCHIELRTLDPAPLTLAELFPPVVNNEANGNGNITSSFTLETTKLNTSCSGAVIGQDLISALQAGKCTQVLRASYLSGDGKMMGTIGVINLATTNGAHHAGKVVGQNDFIAPLAASKGTASKLGQGTGVVEAEYKGHYLILTWSEFVNGSTPSTLAEDNELEQFSSDLVAGTANISLSERMVNTATPAPSASAS
jgi:Mucin-like